MSDLDLAAVMAEHAERWFVGVSGDEVCPKCGCEDAPCETYRLAEALAAEQARVARLGEAIKDTCWKATQYGESADGDTLAYITPKGTMHRLLGAALSVGIPAAFRVAQPTEAAE